MTDENAVRAVALDHVESWFDGDAPRMGRTLHPEYSAMEKLTAQDMIEATANGQGRGEDAEAACRPTKPSAQMTLTRARATQTRSLTAVGPIRA